MWFVLELPPSQPVPYSVPHGICGPFFIIIILYYLFSFFPFSTLPRTKEDANRWPQDAGNIWHRASAARSDALTQGRRDGVRAPAGNFFLGPHSKGKSMETKQSTSYARWPLAASVVNTTNHYLITSEPTERQKNLCNTVGPSSGPAGPGNLYRLPHPLSSLHCSHGADYED